MMRKCGDCQLCCQLLPVSEINKLANQKCRFQQFGKGCKIYSTRPNSCKLWSCGWLIDPKTKNMRRPDKSHYVIDLFPDFITAINEDTGNKERYEVVQVWCDPKYPRAFDVPELKDYLLKTLSMAIIRYSSKDAIVIIYNNGVWLEKRSEINETLVR